MSISPIRFFNNLFFKKTETKPAFVEYTLYGSKDEELFDDNGKAVGILLRNVYSHNPIKAGDVYEYSIMGSSPVGSIVKPEIMQGINNLRKKNE